MKDLIFDCLGKLFAVMKSVYVWENFTLYQVTIGFLLVKVVCEIVFQLRGGKSDDE